MCAALIVPMKIALTYQRIDEAKPTTIGFAPEDYFDPLEAGETYWEHGVEKNLLLEEYLPIEKGLVKWFIVTHEFRGLSRVTRCQLLGEDLSMSTHTIDEHGNEEIITQSMIAPETWHTVRTLKPHDGFWSTYMDNIGSDKKVDGVYRNDNLITSWSFDETKAFCNVSAKDH